MAEDRKTHAHTPTATKSSAVPCPFGQTLWMLRKGGHVAEARTRMDVTGLVLALYIDGALLWHERFAPARGTALGELAEAKRREFEERGWRE